MSYKWKCYLKILGDFLKGRVLALLWLFLHTTTCNEQALAGTTAINLDHEDEDGTLRLAQQRPGRSCGPNHFMGLPQQAHTPYLWTSLTEIEN